MTRHGTPRGRLPWAKTAAALGSLLAAPAVANHVNVITVEVVTTTYVEFGACANVCGPETFGQLYNPHSIENLPTATTECDEAIITGNDHGAFPHPPDTHEKFPKQKWVTLEVPTCDEVAVTSTIHPGCDVCHGTVFHYKPTDVPYVTLTTEAHGEEATISIKHPEHDCHVCEGTVWICEPTGRPFPNYGEKDSITVHCPGSDNGPELYTLPPSCPGGPSTILVGPPGLLDHLSTVTLPGAGPGSPTHTLVPTGANGEPLHDATPIVVVGNPDDLGSEGNYHGHHGHGDHGSDNGHNGHGDHGWDNGHGDHGHGDNGHGDHGHGDHGHGDHGHGDHGHGDHGHGDHGHGDHGHGDHGHGDHGHGDHGHGDHGHGDHGHGDDGHGDHGHGDDGHGDHGHGDDGHGDHGHGDDGHGDHGHDGGDGEGDCPAPGGNKGLQTSAYYIIPDDSDTPTVISAIGNDQIAQAEKYFGDTANVGRTYNLQGYVYGCRKGKYSLVAPNGGSTIFIWVGDKAVNSFSTSNAEITAQGSSRKRADTLGSFESEGNAYIPIRIICYDESDVNCQFSLTSPVGEVLFDSTAQGDSSNNADAPFYKTAPGDVPEFPPFPVTTGIPGDTDDGGDKGDDGGDKGDDGGDKGDDGGDKGDDGGDKGDDGGDKGDNGGDKGDKGDEEPLVDVDLPIKDDNGDELLGIHATAGGDGGDDGEDGSGSGDGTGDGTKDEPLLNVHTGADTDGDGKNDLIDVAAKVGGADALLDLVANVGGKGSSGSGTNNGQPNDDLLKLAAKVGGPDKLLDLAADLGGDSNGDGKGNLLHLAAAAGGADNLLNLAASLGADKDKLLDAAAQVGGPDKLLNIVAKVGGEKGIKAKAQLGDKGLGIDIYIPGIGNIGIGPASNGIDLSPLLGGGGDKPGSDDSGDAPDSGDNTPDSGNNTPDPSGSGSGDGTTPPKDKACKGLLGGVACLVGGTVGAVGKTAAGLVGGVSKRVGNL